MRRSLILYAVPSVLLVLIVVPFALYWSSLPNPIAIHWGITGDPNGSAPPAVLALALAALYAVIAVSVSRVSLVSPAEAPSFVAGSFGIGGLFVVISWLMVAANRDVASWREAGSLGWLQIGTALVVAVMAGAVGWFAAGGNAVRIEREPGELPSVDVADPSAAVWSGRGVGRVVTGIAAGVIVVGLIAGGFSGLILILIGIVALLFAVVRVTVTGRGVVVSLGPWGYPAWKVPLDSVTHAEVESVNPMAYGGWGYRVRPGVRAVVVRAGEGLHLLRSSGPDLVYTVDDAATGAGLINAIVGAPR